MVSRGFELCSWKVAGARGSESRVVGTAKDTMATVLLTGSRRIWDSTYRLSMSVDVDITERSRTRDSKEGISKSRILRCGSGVFRKCGKRPYFLAAKPAKPSHRVKFDSRFLVPGSHSSLLMHDNLLAAL